MKVARPASVAFMAMALAGPVLPDQSDLERAIIAEHNLARTDPARYVELLRERQGYYNGDLLELPDQIPLRTTEGVRAVREAVRAVDRLSPMGP